MTVLTETVSFLWFWNEIVSFEEIWSSQTPYQVLTEHDKRYTLKGVQTSTNVNSSDNLVDGQSHCIFKRACKIWFTANGLPKTCPGASA